MGYIAEIVSAMVVTCVCHKQGEITCTDCKLRNVASNNSAKCKIFGANFFFEEIQYATFVFSNTIYHGEATHRQRSQEG